MEAALEIMTPDVEPDLKLEIAHLLFIDVVGYSKLLVNEQIELMQQLNRDRPRERNVFGMLKPVKKLIRLPTGDGMVLLFFRSPEQPVRTVRCRLVEALRDRPQIQLRMGIHSGPVNPVVDVNDQINMAGAGINIGQRVMDCGDAGPHPPVASTSPKISRNIATGSRTCTISENVR